MKSTQNDLWKKFSAKFNRFIGSDNDNDPFLYDNLDCTKCGPHRWGDWTEAKDGVSSIP